MSTYPKTADEIAEELRGTAESLEAVCEHFEMAEAVNDESFCSEIDQLVFCCDTCGWWCEQSEMSEDEEWVCEDCARTTMGDDR